MRLHRLGPIILVALSSGAAAFAQPVAEPKKYPNEARFDFRGKPLPDELILTPTGADRFVQSEPDGLRITLPKKRGNFSPVAVATRTAVTGDFEITATLEILAAEQPKDGFGVGTTMFINKADSPKEGATIGRLLRPSGKDVVLWDMGFGKKGKDLQFDMDTRPSTDKIFRLRLKRTGAELSYLFGKGIDGDQFEIPPSKTFGTSDLQQVLVRVTSGGQPYAVDARLIELRIRSGATPAPVAVVEPPAAPVQSSRDWLLAALCVLLALALAVVISFGLLLFRIKRIRDDKASQ
jgi:hypothetical protein